MRTIDFLSVFLLLGAAPFWQTGLDSLSTGLGSALLALLLIGAIGGTRSDIEQEKKSLARVYSTSHSNEKTWFSATLARSKGLFRNRKF